MQFIKFFLLPTILLLNACGGGGGGSSSTPPIAPSPSAQAVADSASVDEDRTVSIDVLANDTDVNASSLTITTMPLNGTASVVGVNIQYAPNPDFNGSDTLSYSVNSTSGAPLNANVSITIVDINDAPEAVPDVVSVLENTPTVIAILANDSDIDGSVTTATITTGPNNGSIQITGNEVTYTPNDNFTGSDSFSYRAVDDDVDTSEIVTVSITINPITDTILTITSLPVPSSNFSMINNPDFGTILVSPNQPFTVPPNSVSFSLTLQGNGVAAFGQNLFIERLVDPDGFVIVPLEPNVSFCDFGLCAALVPRRPGITALVGTWQFRLGTLTTILDAIDFSDMVLDIAIRTGPAPDLTAAFPAQLNIKPFLTATSIDSSDLALVLAEFTQMANASNITVNIDPVTIISDPRFNEVSSDFNNVDTAALITMGDADRINLFFLERFSGFGGSGLIGIAGGLPATLGIKGQYNGVLINGTATRNSSDEFFARTTAEFAFHETGHFLGLYHTTEQFFDEHDVLPDTPECTTDLDNNGIADPDECPDGRNIMFWANDFSVTKQVLTEDQKNVFIFSPIATP